MTVYLIVRDELPIIAERSLEVYEGDILITLSDKIRKKAQ